MPIYEFRCEACGDRFEELVAAGTRGSACPSCGAEDAPRILSPPGPALRLVKTPGQKRSQERLNASLRARTKQRFKEARQRTRSSGSGNG